MGRWHERSSYSRTTDDRNKFFETTWSPHMFKNKRVTRNVEREEKRFALFFDCVSNFLESTNLLSRNCTVQGMLVYKICLNIPANTLFNYNFSWRDKDYVVYIFTLKTERIIVIYSRSGCFLAQSHNPFYLQRWVATQCCDSAYLLYRGVTVDSESWRTPNTVSLQK